MSHPIPPVLSELRIVLPDEAATLVAGQAMAQVLQPGMLVFLHGNLGAGKTTLTRGVLRGLGFAGRVKSPTYTLVEPYTLSGLDCYHFDLYRFGSPEEWLDAGFDELVNPTSICLVEWPDKAEGLLPSPDWVVLLSPQGEGRCLVVQACSATGFSCLQKLHIPTITSTC